MIMCDKNNKALFKAEQGQQLPLQKDSVTFCKCKPQYKTVLFSNKLQGQHNPSVRSLPADQIPSMIKPSVLF